MLLMLVLIVMIISVALLLALFSGFLPFMHTYGNVMQYTTAYYGAVSAIERGVLAIRYAGPGFDGESGWKSGSGDLWKPVDAWFPQFYSYGQGSGGLFWEIRSSTNRIPALGKWDVEPQFLGRQGGGSQHFNALDYTHTALIPLGTVGTLSSGEYYRSHNDFSLDQDQVPDTFALSGTFRLNPFLFSTFSGANGNDGFLCRQNCPSHLPEAEQWKEADQVVVTRTIKGKYGDDRVEYTLLPKDGTNLDMATIAPRDSLVRKSKILGALPSAGGTQPYILFGKNTHPFDQNATSPLNIISNNEYQLRQLGNFSSLLRSPEVRNSYLSFSLVNHLRSQGKNLYPFLEYAFETVDGSKIADRFYTLQGQGKVGQYHVKLQVKKPTLEQPALGNFTIIF